MAYDLARINERTAHDPAGFVAECDAKYAANVNRAAESILGNMSRSRVVLLSGPSGSGKTTTAHNIERVIESRGVETRTISLDDYYRDIPPEEMPRGANGEYDFESPELLDLELLREHFRALDAGEEILVPHFDFESRRRDPAKAKPLRLGKNEIALFEGIHALNSAVTGEDAGARASKVYISARSNIELDGKTVFKGTWIRILRRAIRDRKFRGMSPAGTFAMWENLRIGEKKYISPYKNTAQVIFDSSFEYEVSVLRCLADGLFDEITDTMPRAAEICALERALELFEPLSPKFVPESSLIREFIGREGL